jgi:hypothetical protein
MQASAVFPLPAKLARVITATISPGQSLPGTAKYQRLPGVQIMGCGEERIGLPKNHAAVAAQGVTPGNRRLFIVRSSAKPQLAQPASGPCIPGTAAGRDSARYGGLRLVRG